MTEQTYFILASLIDGPLHGYVIVSQAERLSGGRVRLSAGTLYGALERLDRDGLVEGDGEETVAGRRRRYYRLSDEGAAVLRAEAQRMRAAAAVVDGRKAAFTLKRRPGVA
jgi:DNA-binding PadR family transcriptional regulator